jgi:apolipoprotein N-acyltransferase
VLAVVVWGGVRLTQPTPPGPRVVLVDGAAAEVGESTLERYIAATPAVDGPATALVVWPESALPIDLAEDGAAWTRLSRFVLSLGTPLATGGIGRRSTPAAGSSASTRCISFGRDTAC